jgi:hypothetical protein
LRNISEGGIRCPCKRCKNKKFLDSDIVMMHLLEEKKKGFIKKCMCWYPHREPCVPHDVMIEKMVRSAYSFSNMHGVIDDNNNPYNNIIMDAMGMN